LYVAHLSVVPLECGAHVRKRRKRLGNRSVYFHLEQLVAAVAVVVAVLLLLRRRCQDPVVWKGKSAC
jgi:hypothetical protein